SGERVYPGGQIGTDPAVLGGDPRTTVGSGSEAAEFVGSVGGAETTSADGTEMTSARTAMGPTKAQTKARAPSRERRVIEAAWPEIYCFSGSVEFLRSDRAPAVWVGSPEMVCFLLEGWGASDKKAFFRSGHSDKSKICHAMPT